MYFTTAERLTTNDFLTNLGFVMEVKPDPANADYLQVYIHNDALVLNSASIGVTLRKSQLVAVGDRSNAERIPQVFTPELSERSRELAKQLIRTVAALVDTLEKVL